MEYTKKVILWIETSGIYGRAMLAGVAKYSRLHGPWSFYRKPPVYINHSSQKDAIKRIKQFDPDGIIVRQTEEIEPLFELDLPIIISPWNKELVKRYPYIIGNCPEITKMAAEHLIDRGFINFAYCGFEGLPFSKRRAEGFTHYLESLGFHPHIYESPHRKQARFWVREKPYLTNWLKSLPKPIGVMACNDDRGQDVLEACADASIQVPDAVAVIAVGNDPTICEFSNPPLSSVVTDGERAGYEAAAMLDRLMSGKEEMNNQRILVQPKYVVTRHSTDVLAIEDRYLANALRFIRQNAKSYIQVSDVVEAVFLSRRMLEKKFRQTLGHSIHKEICRKRIEQIKMILIETDKPVYEIAAILGFGTADSISRFFTRETGVSPLAFRKNYTKSITPLY
jgi:LacI family transcriptional regulator